MSFVDRGSILFISSITADQGRALEQYAELVGRPIRPILLRDRRKTVADAPELANLIDLAIDMSNLSELEQALVPYRDDIIAVTCKDDASAAYLANIIPHLPHIVMPRPETLTWSTEKTEMRARLRKYHKASSPKYDIVSDTSAATIKRIERTVGYPMVVKPSGMTSSMLISVCYFREELEAALADISQTLVFQSHEAKLAVLVEQYMEDGIYYSIDAYVGPRGAIVFTPPVFGKTGHDIGFDDFFGYLRMTPTLLNPKDRRECEQTAAKAIRALNLRSTTCHIELMHTPRGWMIIELGPRIGGFRHELYSHAFGINHALNDLLIRSGLRPIVPKRPKGYAVAMQFYPRQEGRLAEIQGLDVVRNSASLKRLAVFKEPGELCQFAKHGGGHVVEMVLFNSRRSALLADIRRIEQNLVIVTEPITHLTGTKPSRVKR